MSVVTHKLRDDFDPGSPSQFAETNQDDTPMVGREPVDKFPEIFVFGEEWSGLDNRSP